MIIDFHTHIWPDGLAERAMKTLTENAKGEYTPVTDGTASGLYRKMNEWNIDKSVVLPVQTKASQTKTLNDFAAKLNEKTEYEGKIISFGGIWPYTENIKHDIDYIVSLNLKGIKFHPEYQNFNIDDEQFFPLYEYALSKGLILIFHAGADIAFEGQLHSSPKQFKHLAEEMGGGVIVAAHFGGHLQTEEALEVLDRASADVLHDRHKRYGGVPALPAEPRQVDEEGFRGRRRDGDRGGDSVLSCDYIARAGGAEVA